MAKLYFKVAADYEKVIRLREEIDRLKQTLLSMDVNKNKKEVKELEKQLKTVSDEFKGLVVEASRAAAEMEHLAKKNKQTEESFGGVESMAKKAAAVLGGAFAIGGAKELISQMVKVRGEFQAMDTSIQTLLGSKEKADKLLAQVKEYAKISPLDLKSVNSATQMMLGFNIEAEKVPGYLKAIGDISMGDAGRFNSLTLAFSQMSATGKLMGQDLNQMINAGFNPLSTMAEKTGKSISTLKEEMSKGAISAEMVQQAFIDATSAGGKFFGMSENASKTINGQLSMLQDAMDATFNEMGEKSEGIIMGTIQATTSLIQNYETIGKVMTGLVATYGTYRAAVMLTTVSTKGWTIAQLANYNVLLLVEKAQKLLNATMLANPYVLAATALVGLVSAMWVFHDSSTEAEKAQKRFNESQEEAAKKEQEHKQKIDALIDSSRDIALADLQRGQSLSELRKEYPKIFAEYDIETIKLADILKLKQQIAEEDAKRAGVKQEQEFSDIESQIKYYENLLSTMSGSQGVDGYVKKLKELRAERDIMLQEKGKNISEQFISSLKDININDFDRYINELEKRIKGQGKDGKVKMKLPIDIQGNLSEEALYDVKDIKTLIDTAKEVKKTKEEVTKAEKKAGADWLLSYKKQYEDADKAYNDFLKSKEVMSEAARDEELKRLKGLRDTAKATYESKGGVTGNSNSKTDKQESETEKQQKQLEEYNKALTKQAKEQIRFIEDMEMRIAQARVDVMDEGNDKALAQIQLDYDKRYLAIQREEKELLQKLQDEERTRWEQENLDFRKKGLQFTSTITSLSSEDKERFAKEYSLAYQKQEKDTQSLLDKLLVKYRDYDAQRTAIEEDGNKEIAYLQSKRTEENSEEVDRAIQVTKDKIKEGIQQINNEESKHLQKDNPFFVKLFGDATQMTRTEIKNLLDQAKQLQKYLSGTSSDKIATFLDIPAPVLKRIKESPEALKALQDAIEKLTKEGNKGAFDKMLDDIDKALDKIRKGGSKNVGEGITDIGEAIQAVMPVVYQFGEDLGAIFGSETGDYAKNIAQLGESVLKIGTGVGKFMSGDILGGITSVVSGVAQIFSMANEANARHKAALKAIMTDTLAQQREYNLLLMQQNLEYEKATTIFGTDAYGKAANAVTVMKDAVADLNEELKGTSDQKKKQSKDALLRKFFGVANPQEELKKAYAGLAGIEIVTGHKKTGLFGWGKGKDVYSSILDAYPELIDANGKLDKTLAETIINTRKMSDESKAALQNMIDLADQAEAAYDELNSYLTDIFGSLGETMTDALVDAFENGTDAAKAFTDSVSDMLESLAKQMIYSVTLAPLMEKAQKDMLDVMQNTGLSDEQKFRNWTNILDNLVDDAIGQQSIANRMFEYYQRTAKEKGFDIFTGDSSSQEATRKGFETMSQDTGSELLGRFTALQMSGEEIKTQSVIQTGLLSSINEKMSLLDYKVDLPTLTANVPDVAGQNREVITNSYQPQINVVFPDGKIDSLTNEVSTLRGIVNEMRSAQMNSFLEMQEGSLNTRNTVKCLREIKTEIEEVKKNTEKL